MKPILPVMSFVFLIAFTTDAQTETDVKTKQTISTEQSSSDDQATLSKNEDIKIKCEGKSKEECKKQCDGKEKAEYHKSQDEMNKKECKPGCEKECCSSSTEEAKQTDESSGQK